MGHNIVAVWVCAEVSNLGQNFIQHKRNFLSFKPLKNSLNNSTAIYVFGKLSHAAFAPLNKLRDVAFVHLLDASLDHMVSVLIKHDARADSNQRLDESFLHLRIYDFNCLLNHPTAKWIESQHGYLLLDDAKHQIDLLLVGMLKHLLNHIVPKHIPHKTAIRAKLFFTQRGFVRADLFVQGLRLAVF